MSESSAVFWAAFGGGVAAGLITLVAVLAAEWYRWFLDRPLVKVQASIGYIVGEATPTQYLFFKAKNPHSKPVILSTFGLSYKREEWGTLFVNPQRGYQFPYRLEGGAAISQWTPIQEVVRVLKKNGRKPSDLKWVWFESSTGTLFQAGIDSKVIQQLTETFHEG